MESLIDGTLDKIRIPEIIFHLSQQKATGALHLKHHPSIEKTLFFEEGRIVFATSNDPDDRLGVLLLRRNRVTYRQLEECAAKVEPGKRLGTVLVLEGVIQPNDLYQGVIDQIKEIVYGVFDWEEGTFHFEPGPLSQKEVITLNLPAPELIMSGMQRIRRWSWLKKTLPDLDAVYRKREGWSPIVRQMSLNRNMEAILDLFDRPRTLEEVLQTSSLGNFETCRLLWTFLIVGVIEEILVAPDWIDEQAMLPSATIDPLSTEEIPVLAPEGPTLKLRLTEETGLEEKTIPSLPADDLEPLLAGSAGFPELSFSDIADLTDAETEQNIQQEKPALHPWEMMIAPDLKNFNEIHRYLYEMISLELGKGADTFVSKVFKKACTKHPLVFDGVTMNEYGELGEPELLTNIQGNLVEDYQQALDFLLAEERSMISLFLEMKRVDVIENGLKRILERRNRSVH